jgi:alkanesulfonate monooxygenase SsuD/methylene tetrahydromethanopterin reductase-like flavin-dependent oxidoreductase (luciferase family)
MTHPLRFGLKLWTQDYPIQTHRDVWRIADEGGFDHVWNFDHLAAIDYPAAGFVGPDRPIYEGWTMQAAMAEATKRVRIGCLVTGNTYRNPIVLAKMAVTVDHLSGGRLEFGIGAGWAEVEHKMYGIEGLEHRVGYLSESLQIIKSLFTQERTNFEGRYYHFKDAIANPKPIQKPYPPLWIGASGATTLRLVARHADVWNISGSEPDVIAGLIKQLEEACGAVGRDPSEIRRSVQFDWDGKDKGELIDTSGKLLELGITEQVIYLRRGEPVAVAEKAAALLPELRQNERKSPEVTRR